MPRVNPDILRWARETAALPPEDAARKVQLRDSRKGTAVERLHAMEAGEELPTRAMLRRMSKAYRRPLVAFYLAEVPRRGDRGEDFRSLPFEPEEGDEAHLDALLRQIKIRQRLVRAVLEDEDEAEPLDFVASMRMSDGASAVANAVQATLGLSIEEFRAQPDASSAFSFVRDKAEEAGVFVLLVGDLGSHHTALDPVVFRGFALADEVAPFVVINDRDSRMAWTFTLLHELVHLWIGQTGVSGGAFPRGIERFCNDAASELLVSAEDLASLPDPHPLSSDARQELVATYSRKWNVSHSLLAYRLYRKGRLSKQAWGALNAHYRERWRLERESSRDRHRAEEGGPGYYTVRRHRLGGALVNLTGRMLASGALSTTKAGRILGVRPANVARVVEPVLLRSGR